MSDDYIKESGVVKHAGGKEKNRLYPEMAAGAMSYPIVAEKD